MRKSYSALKGAFTLVRPRLRTALAVIAGGVVFSTSLAACGDSFDDKDDVYSSPDHTICIYDKEDGRLIEQLAPGADKVRVEDDAIVVMIPTSNRFYFVTPEDAKRDPGAPKYLTGRESGYRDVVTVAQARFRFDVNKACRWYEQHGRRNADANGDLGFNVRGDATTGWARWLNENVAPAMQSVNEPTVFNYAWPYHEYNYPINADINGIVNGDPEVATRIDMQNTFGEQLSNNLAASLGDTYFCGISYDPAKPEVCPDIVVDVYSVELVDQQPVLDRQNLKNLEESTVNANQMAVAISDGTEAAKAEKQAQVDRDNALAEIEKTDKLADQARERELLEDKQLTDALNAQQVATENLSACAEAAKLNGGTISPEDCARLLLALKGLSPNVAGDGVVISGN